MNIREAIELAKHGIKVNHPDLPNKAFKYYECLHGDFLINEDFEENDIQFFNENNNPLRDWKEIKELYKHRELIIKLTDEILIYLKDSLGNLTGYEKETLRENIIFEISNKLREIE